MPNKTLLKKIATVNVIHIESGNFQSIRSFNDDVEGNEHANKTFVSLIGSRLGGKLDADDRQYYLNEGYFTDDNGTEYFLTHSDTDKEKV